MRVRRAREAPNLAWYHDGAMTNIPIKVYGINLLVRMMAEAPADVRVNCPKGLAVGIEIPVCHYETCLRGLEPI